MAQQDPIVIIEDDMDDQEFVKEILKEMDVKHEIIFFGDAIDALAFLKTTSKQPFLIICDINLPKMNGFEFKIELDNDAELRKKSIPFIFFSTDAAKPVVTEAFTKLTVQGFFKKSYTFEDLKQNLKIILDYWKLCKHPHRDS